MTVPNVPALLPPDRPKLNAALVRPLIRLPSASLATIVIVSVLPDATVGEARETLELLALIGPALTVNVGVLASATLLTVAVSVLTVPAVVAVIVAV